MLIGRKNPNQFRIKFEVQTEVPPPGVLSLLALPRPVCLASVHGCHPAAAAAAAAQRWRADGALYVEMIARMCETGHVGEATEVFNRMSVRHPRR